MSSSRSHPPSVESVLSLVRPRLEAGVAGDAVRDAARAVIDDERRRLSKGEAGRDLADLAEATVARLGSGDLAGAGLATVINATGVIVHTNLGRAAWPQAAIEAAARAAAEPVLLELDRESGRRGHRFRAAEEALVTLSGADDALVTNNNAAALALAVGLARRRGGVVVSRGELVEIGGGVRIPEIVRRAGGRLIEVGTTNRTRAADYEAPLAEGRAALILRVHRSNFRQEGFVESPADGQLAALARRHAVPLIDDLGSGALLETSEFGLAHEPTPRERLSAGADIVTFSGDKLVGGPQAGLIVGRGDLVARMRRDPLARAMRPDKVTLAAVAATLTVYAAGRARLDIPVWRAIAADPALLRTRAGAVLERLAPATAVDIVASQATVGGGALPGATLPSVALRLGGLPADGLLRTLRTGTPCVIGRIERGAVLLDLRTVPPEADGALARAVEAAVGRAAR